MWRASPSALPMQADLKHEPGSATPQALAHLATPSQQHTPLLYSHPQTPLFEPSPYFQASSITYQPFSLFSQPPYGIHCGSPSPAPASVAVMQANNAGSASGQPGQGQGQGQQMPGQVNMSQLVRAQHISNLPNLSLQQKKQFMNMLAQYSAVVQNSPQGSQEYNHALTQWQGLTQKYMQARQAAQRAAAGQQPGGQQGGGQNMNMNMANMMAQGGGQNLNMQNMGQTMPGQQGQQAGGQQGQQQRPPGQNPVQGIPQQVMDYVNKYNYYHPSGIGPGHPDYEKYKQDVKTKHANILWDHERHKIQLKKLKGQIEQMKAQGQEIPEAMQKQHLMIENKTSDLRTQLDKWQANQKIYKDKYEAQQRAAGGGGATSSTSDSNTNTMQANSPTTGQPQQRQGSTTGQMSPSLPTPQQNAQTMGQQPNTNFATPAQSGAQSQQTPVTAGGAQQGQRQSISGQQPPMPNMQSGPQNPQQGGGQPTPLSHQQALQRAYSGGTPASANTAAQTGPGPQQTQHQASQPSHPSNQAYAGGQPPPRETSTTSSSSNMNPSAKLMTSKNISPSLSQPPVPVQNFPQARPTMAGPANGVGGIMGQPAIQKPTFNLEMADGSNVLTKKKLHELIRQVTGGGEGLGTEVVTPDCEEAFLQLADEFVDNVIIAACKLARLRDSSTLEVRDIQLILERNYNIRVPGYASDELRAIRKFAPAPGWTAKMNAIQAAKVMGGKNEL